MFSGFKVPEIQVFASDPIHYRMRAEFRIWHDGDQSDYAMYVPGNSRRLTTIKDFPQASRQINVLMPVFRDAFNTSDCLRKRLYAIEFLSGQSSDDDKVISHYDLSSTVGC